MDRKTVQRMLKMVRDGDDIPAPAALLKISAKNASKRLPGFPYSIHENLWHAVFWQDMWLNAIEGKPNRDWTEDWQSPAESEWPDTKERFLKNIDQAIRLAGRKELKHSCKTDKRTAELLMNIAVHDAYHLGQITLIKRVLRKQK